MNITQHFSDDRHLIKEISQIECAIIDALCSDDHWLTPAEESALRWALSLARVSSVVPSQNETTEVVIGHATDTFRTNLVYLLGHLVKDGKVDKRGVLPVIKTIADLCAFERKDLLELYGAQLTARDLDNAVRTRPLALALGGGGGTAFIYLGAFEALQREGIIPAAIAGTSMGAVLGAYRARYKEFSLEHLKLVMGPISFGNIAQPFEGASQFSLPATFKLHLHDIFTKQFGHEGAPLKLSDMEIPFRVCVAGVSHIEGEPDPDLDGFAHLLDASAENIMELRREEKSITAKILELTRRPFKAIFLGGDDLTRDFNVIDAVGFSAAVPGIFHYDILKDDARMEKMLAAVMKRYGVYRLVDGGFADNLPSQEALRAVQEGTKQRDPFVLALDGFAPNYHRHWLFMPLMQIAAQNTRKGREEAHLTITYKHVLSPLNVVPSKEELMRAMHNGIEETKPHLAFIRKILGPIEVPDFVKTG